MSVATQSINMDHVGPIEHLSIPIPEHGGVVVLRGRNGTGKSHAINAVEALYNPGSRKQLRNSDGTPSGRVEGLGVTLRLGRSNTARGQLVCESLDGRVDPSMLVDPGLKDPLAADTRRLAVLVRLAGIKVGADDWQTVLSEVLSPEEIGLMVDDDPVASADRIRRKLHDLALSSERLSEAKLAESRTLANTIHGIDLEAECDRAKLQQQFEAATAELGAVLSRREVSCKHQRDRLAARELLATNEAKAIALDQAQANVAETRKFIAAKADQKAEMQQTIAELQSRVDACEREIAASESLLKQQIERVEHAKAQQEQLAQWRAVVESDALEPVPDAEVEKAKQAKEEAAKRMEQGETIRRAKEQARKADALALEAGEIGGRAEKLRALARSTDSVLEQSLVDAGFNTIKVYQGRLCVESDRGLEAFSDLSHGERWRHALDLAAAGLPSGSVLPVCQEAFEALDPENRRFVHSLAVERGLVIVTAEASDGELRAEVLGSEVGDE